MKYAAVYIAFGMIVFLAYLQLGASWFSNGPGHVPLVDRVVPITGFVAQRTGLLVALPKIELREMSGHQMFLSEFVGNLVVVSFVTKECIPCFKELRQLDDVAKRITDTNITIMAIVVDDSNDANSNLSLGSPEFAALRIYFGRYSDVVGNAQLVGVPTTLVVDPSGSEIGRTIGPAEWNSRSVVDALRLLASNKKPQ